MAQMSTDEALEKQKKTKIGDDEVKLRPYPLFSEAHEQRQKRLVHQVEVFASTVSAIGRALSFLLKPFSLLFAFFGRLFAKPKPERPVQEFTEPTAEAVFVADSEHAMNQEFFFKIQEGRIWYKAIAAPKRSPWKLFGDDGLPPHGRMIKAISSDGLNVIAVDDSAVINYVHTEAIHFHLTDDDWIIDSIDLDWTDQWLAVPIAGSIKTFLGNNQLRLPEQCQQFAISQKGSETGYYTDIGGKVQPEFLVGVTTLYALNADGRIYFADPWLANGFNNELTAPEEGQFVAEAMAAAASTVFLFRRNEVGIPCMYTRFADFDSLGSNPFLPATYDLDNRTPLVRCLPAEDWVQQPSIPLVNEQAKLTAKIAILQTGRGQHNRELRVEGSNEHGMSGYYFKKIYEQQWHFQETPGVFLHFKELPSSSQCPPPAKPVDFGGTLTKIPANLPIQSVVIKNFLRHGLNERGLHTVVEWTLTNGRTITMPLYARRGLAHLFGQKNNMPYWVLVMPKMYKTDEDPEVQALLKSLFHGSNELSVSVHELENGDLEFLSKARGVQCLFKAREVSEQGSSIKSEKTETVAVTITETQTLSLTQMSAGTFFDHSSKKQDEPESPSQGNTYR